MNQDRKTTIRRMVVGLVISVVLEFLDPNTFIVKIPSYGLSAVQVLLLVWVPVSAAFAWRPLVPLRWWCHYGLLSLLVLMLSFSHWILTTGGGRSYDEEWYLYAVAFAGYLIASSVNAAIIREWFWMKRSKHDNNGTEPIR